MELIKVTDDIGKNLLEKCKIQHCRSCGKQIRDTDGSWKKYLHNSGIQIYFDLEKYWYFYECECGYQSSLSKLRFER